MLKVLHLFATIENPQLPKSTYPIYLSKDCDDDTKYDGLIISIIIMHALTFACASISPLSHGHMHRAISYRAVQLYIRYVISHSITFYIAACCDINILYVLRSSLLIYCPSKYVKERKRSWKLVARYWKCLNMAHDVNWDVCFLCS